MTAKGKTVMPHEAAKEEKAVAAAKDEKKIVISPESAMVMSVGVVARAVVAFQRQLSSHSVL